MTTTNQQLRDAARELRDADTGEQFTPGSCDGCGRPARWHGGGGAVAEAHACDACKDTAAAACAADSSLDPYTWMLIPSCAGYVLCGAFAETDGVEIHDAACPLAADAQTSVR